MGVERRIQAIKSRGMESVLLCQKSKILNVPYLLTVVAVKTNCQACNKKPGICSERRDTKMTGTAKWVAQSVCLESPRIRAATIQHCKLLHSFLLWCRRNRGRAWLRSSIAINLRSLKSLQKCVYVGSPNVKV